MNSGNTDDTTGTRTKRDTEPAGTLAPPTTTFNDSAATSTNNTGTTACTTSGTRWCTSFNNTDINTFVKVLFPNLFPCDRDIRNSLIIIQSLRTIRGILWNGKVLERTDISTIDATIDCAKARPLLDLDCFSILLQWGIRWYYDANIITEWIRTMLYVVRVCDTIQYNTLNGYLLTGTINLTMQAMTNFPQCYSIQRHGLHAIVEFLLYLERNLSTTTTTGTAFISPASTETRSSSAKQYSNNCELQDFVYREMMGFDNITNHHQQQQSNGTFNFLQHLQSLVTIFCNNRDMEYLIGNLLFRMIHLVHRIRNNTYTNQQHSTMRTQQQQQQRQHNSGTIATSYASRMIDDFGFGTYLSQILASSKNKSSIFRRNVAMTIAFLMKDYAADIPIVRPAILTTTTKSYDSTAGRTDSCTNNTTTPITSGTAEERNVPTNRFVVTRASFNTDNNSCFKELYYNLFSTDPNETIHSLQSIRGMLLNGKVIEANDTSMIDATIDCAKARPLLDFGCFTLLLQRGIQWHRDSAVATEWIQAMVYVITVCDTIQYDILHWCLEAIRLMIWAMCKFQECLSIQRYGLHGIDKFLRYLDRNLSTTTTTGTATTSASSMEARSSSTTQYGSMKELQIFVYREMMGFDNITNHHHHQQQQQQQSNSTFNFLQHLRSLVDRFRNDQDMEHLIGNLLCCMIHIARNTQQIRNNNDNNRQQPSIRTQQQQQQHQQHQHQHRSSNNIAALYAPRMIGFGTYLLQILASSNKSSTFRQNVARTIAYLMKDYASHLRCTTNDNNADPKIRNNNNNNTTNDCNNPTNQQHQQSSVEVEKNGSSSPPSSSPSSSPPSSNAHPDSTPSLSSSKKRRRVSTE